MDDLSTSWPTEDNEAPPVCPCHSYPMRWHRDPRRKAGGYWRCRIQRRESDRRYDTTENRRTSWRRYRQSDKGRAAQDRYRNSPTYRRYQMRVAQRRWQAQIERIEAELKQLDRGHVSTMDPRYDRGPSQLFSLRPTQPV